MNTIPLHFCPIQFTSVGESKFCPQISLLIYCFIKRKLPVPLCPVLKEKIYYSFLVKSVSIGSQTSKTYLPLDKSDINELQSYTNTGWIVSCLEFIFICNVCIAPFVKFPDTNSYLLLKSNLSKYFVENSWMKKLFALGNNLSCVFSFCGATWEQFRTRQFLYWTCRGCNDVDQDNTFIRNQFWSIQLVVVITTIL